MTLPEATKVPCNDCPWRVNAIPGWLGPHTAEEWASAIHGEQPIACHITITDDDDWNAPGMKQCRGAAIMRANVFKLPRNKEIVTGPRDTDSVFPHTNDFVQYHNKDSG